MPFVQPLFEEGLSEDLNEHLDLCRIIRYLTANSQRLVYTHLPLFLLDFFLIAIR